MRSFNRFNNFLMTFATRLFCYFETMLGNAYVVFEPTSREVIRVPEAVACLGGVLADKLRWCMAVVTNGRVAMARLHPCAVLLLHNMAICTGLRIVGQVRITLSVDERVRANANRETKSNAKDDSLSKPKPLHVDFNSPASLPSCLPNCVANETAEGKRVANRR